MAKAKIKTDAKAKSNTAADIRKLSDDQISVRVIDIAKEQLGLRFQKASGQAASNTKTALPLRREVARLKTEQSARRISAQKSAVKSA